MITKSKYIQYIILRLHYFGWWLALIVFETAGQISLKITSQMMKGTAFGWQWWSKSLFSWTMWVALICYGFSFLIWLNILKQTELSIAFPVSSLNYITIILASWIIFHEPIGLFHLLGVMLIMIGVITLSWGENE